MNGGAKSEPIGEGLAWADVVCRRAIENPGALSAASVEFVMGIAGRLDRYGKDTLLSEKQLEWLAGIDRQLDGDDE